VAEDLTRELRSFQAEAESQQAAQQEQAAAEREQTCSKQIELGYCNVTPLPKVATQPFRSELTIENHSLFVANHYKEDFFVRQWLVKHPESGEEVIRRLTVGKTNEEDRARGVLTQTHQDMFYKLLKLWGDRGYRLGTWDGKTYGSFTMSAYELVHALRGSDGVRHYRRVQILLQDLTSIPVVLENVYTWQGLQDRLQFTLLNGVQWKDRGVDEKTKLPKRGGTSEVSILFSEMVTEGFLNKHVKTLLGEPYRSLGTGKRARGETARLLYPMLDAQLSKKERYRVRLQALEERFGFLPLRYKAHRKRRFASAIRMLDGKLISRGDYRLRVVLQDSEDGKDCVLSARREAPNQLSIFLS